MLVRGAMREEDACMADSAVAMTNNNGLKKIAKMNSPTNETLKWRTYLRRLEFT